MRCCSWRASRVSIFSGARESYCNAHPGFCDGGTPPGPDGGPDGGPDAGPPTCKATPPDAGPLPNPPPAFDAGIVARWVNGTSGLDTNSGQQSSPFKTIGQALSTVGSGPATIYVCAGTYAAAFSVQQPISILGGYNCTTWTRTPTFGFVSFDAGFDGVNETILTVPSGSCSPVITFSSSAVAHNTLLEGVSVKGSASCANGYTSTPFAVQVSGGAAPLIHNCNLQGGAGTGGSGAVGSGALAILGGSPDVAFNWISGGAGISVAREGSAGIFIDSGPEAPTIHDNRINGGSGSSSVAQGGAVPGIGSVGIANYGGQLQGQAAIAHNWITGGSGTDTNSTSGTSGGQGSVGVYLYFSGSAAADLMGNYIEGGSGSTSGSGAYATAAVFSNSHTASKIEGNAIFGGEPGTNGVSVGVFLSTGNASSAAPTLTNNMIHSGNRTSGGRGIGIRVADVTGAQILHNTIAAASNSIGLDFAQAGGGGSPTGTTANNNLFLGFDGATSTGVQFTSGGCSPMTAFKANALVGGFSAESNLPLCGGPSTTPTALESSIDSAAGGTPVATGTLTTASACGASNCLPRPACTSASSCVSDIVGGMGGDEGLTSLMTLVGWPLKTGVPCQISQSTNQDSLVVPADFYRVPRWTEPSIGAAELYCGCQ